MKQVSWFKRYLALAMTLFLMLSLIPMQIFAAEEGTLRDMPSKSYWAYEALNSAVENDILRGNDGRLNPRGLVTRGQLAAILNRVFGAVEMADISAFTDIPAGYALKNDLAKALQMKTMQGNGTLMNPTGNVTRQQAFTMIARALKLENGALAALDSFSDKDQIASYARGPLAAMVSAGYVSGSNGKLNPKSMVSREQVAQVLYNIFAKYIRAAGTYSGEQAGNVIVNVPGVTFKDATITGDLILGEGLADGEVTLDNTIVQGRLVVRGGGANSIRIINNSNVGSIIVSKTASGGVRVLCSEGARVEMVYVNDGVDEVNLEGSFKSVKVGSEVGVALTNANVSELNIEAANADVEVRSGSVSNVTLAESAANADLALGKGTSVGNLTIASDAAADVTVAGKVANVTVERGSNTAAQTTLNIENTAKINTVNVEKGAATNIDAAKGANIGTVKAEDKSDVSGSGANNTNKGNGGGGGNGGNGGNNNPPQNPTTSVSTQSALLAALENDDVQAITVSGSITMNENWLYVEKDLTIARGVTLTVDHLIVWGECTLSNNGTLATKAHGSIEINRDCTLTNAGTMNVGEDTGITVRGTLENTSNNGFIMGKNACITAYAGATVLGIPGTVYAGNGHDTYLADGSFVSGDQSKDIQTDGQAQLVATSSNLSAYVYGTTGLQNALAAAEASTSAKPMYSGLFLCADEDTSNNTIQLDGKHAMDSIVYVYEGVTLNIGSGAELTARQLNWYGTVNIDSNGVLTVNYADGSGTLVNKGTLKSNSVYAYGNALLDNSAGKLDANLVHLSDNATATGMAGQELNINSWAYDYYYPDADDDEMSADPGVTVDGVSQINGRIACVYGSEALQRALSSGINYDGIDLLSDGTSSVSSVRIGSDLTVKSLSVGNGVTLTVASGVTLTVKDSLDINGTLMNNGTLNVEQTDVHVYGTLDNRSGSILFTEETK